MFAIISHDAGGAEILSSYVDQNDIDCLYVLDGPAIKIFKKKLGEIEIICLEEAIQKSTTILCSTSWQSDIEFNAIKMACSMGKRSIAFLDHWVNYSERFTRSGEICLPDEIWVGDVMAELIARQLFPNTKVSLIENPYINYIRKELAVVNFKRVHTSDSINVLYICEPVSEHALSSFGNERHWGYTEEDALRYFLVNIKALGLAINRVLIRPHPSETEGKYNWVQQEFNLSISIGGGCTLIEEIAESEVVVGCQSMAMVVGLIANKRVISCIPPKGKPCSLPHDKIENFNNILNESR